jgi:hypothetical protein
LFAAVAACASAPPSAFTAEDRIRADIAVLAPADEAPAWIEGDFFDEMFAK